MANLAHHFHLDILLSWGLNIDWPIEFDKAITSEKDAVQPTLTEFEKDNPFVYGEI